MPCASHTDSSRRWKYLACPPDHGAIAPSATESSGSGTTSSGSTSYTMPRPSHSGHAPYGELNEKLRGASSSKLLPSDGRDSFSENVSTSGSPSFGMQLDLRHPLGQHERRLHRLGEAPLDPSRSTSRSTTTSIVCCS